MSRVIGRGRYATETYPERSGGGGGIIQVGYAQNEKSRTLDPTVAPFDTEIPMDIGAAPLRVVFSSVTPGNFLEVDINLNPNNTDAIAHEFSFVAAVSFAAAPVFPADFQIISNSVAGGSMAPGFQTYRSLSSVEIPVGATKATIAVPYNNANLAFITIYGTDSFAFTPGSWLKASEVAGSSVTQPGSGTLLPIPP